MADQPPQCQQGMILDGICWKLTVDLVHGLTRLPHGKYDCSTVVQNPLPVLVTVGTCYESSFLLSSIIK